MRNGAAFFRVDWGLILEKIGCCTASNSKLVFTVIYIFLLRNWAAAHNEPVQLQNHSVTGPTAT
ncbi:hypothetical protein [Methanobacterium aggregans]|uniref:hypothetical protein n=1 Tax=Methanobacterium aggregans TaxID=1615586 RepID=UPI001AE3EE64|nr:hypothetical protein [Methanobacterium aggregans]MBP2045286.1 hypothetical protein [Methanobacterium aggregans]